MSLFRKKPVVVEAFQMTAQTRLDNSNWPVWLHSAWNANRNSVGALQRVDCAAVLPDMLEIVTLEGNHRVGWGDYIIQGVHGELYPCKPDIFVKTYDSAVLVTHLKTDTLVCEGNLQTATATNDEPTPPIMQFFNYTHLPESLQATSRYFHNLAHTLLCLPNNSERAVALRKLLEAKDAAVRSKNMK